MERAEPPLEETQRKVVVIILKDADGWFFVHQRPNRQPNPGKYGLGAGGWLDFDEGVEDKTQAAQRKLEEETGIIAFPKHRFSFEFPEGGDKNKREVHVFDTIVNRHHVGNRKGWVKTDWLTIREVDSLESELCPETIVVWEHYKTWMHPDNLPVPPPEKLIADFLTMGSVQTTENSEQVQEYVVQEAGDNVTAYPKSPTTKTPAKPFKKEQEKLIEVVIRFSTAMKGLSEKDHQLLLLKAKGWSYQQIIRELEMSESDMITRLRRIGERWKNSV